MEKLVMCRICSVENVCEVRMYEVVDKNLQELYEKLTDVPFVTEDARPMLVCFFCCAKIKQCAQFQRKCLESEERFTKMMSEDCKPTSSVNHGQLEFYGGFIKTSVEHLSIDDECKIENNAIKEELPDLCESPDDNEQKEQQSDELEQKYLLDSYTDIEDIPRHHSEAHSEDDVFLIEFKTEIEEHEVSNELNKRTAMETESAPAAKKSKQDVQKDVKENSISWEDRKQGQEKHIGEKPYKCDICQRSFGRNADLKKHSRLHTGEHYKCDICQRSFGQKGNFKIHIRTHTGEKPYKCDICQRRFNHKGNFNTHIRTHTGEKPYKCDICQRSFGQKGNFKIHIRTHTGEKPYKCDICQRSFGHKSQLKRHIRTHTCEKPYKCDICQSSFSDKSNLKHHIRTHTGEKPYKCDICQRNFFGKGSLKTHIRTHTGEKPYKCDICQRSFGRKANLKTHTRLHTGEKPYKCDICQRSFGQKDYFKIHIRTHTGEKPYKCDICQSSFSAKRTLKNHIFTHTDVEKPYKCYICPRSFERKGNLTTHIRTHIGEKSYL